MRNPASRTSQSAPDTITTTASSSTAQNRSLRTRLGIRGSFSNLLSKARQMVVKSRHVPGSVDSSRQATVKVDVRPQVDSVNAAVSLDTDATSALAMSTANLQPTSHGHRAEFLQTQIEPSPFPVGIELERRDLGKVTAESESDDRLSSRSDSFSPFFIPQIRYNALSTDGFEARVLIDATSEQISAMFSVPLSVVDEVWLFGVRYPLPPPVSNLSAGLPEDAARDPFSTQQAPAKWQLPPELAESSTNEHSESGATSSSDTGSLDPTQFADLFAQGNEISDDIREFGNTLIAKLEALFAPQPPARSRWSPFHRPYQEEVRQEERMGDRISRWRVRDDEEEIPSSSVQVASACGFCVTYIHPHIEVLGDGYAILKCEAGLYKTVRANGCIRSGAEGNTVQDVNFYFEVHVVEDQGAGGICIGVGPSDIQRNKLIGSDSRSCGLHSTGMIVRRGEEFCSFGNGTPFCTGDRVGCLVTCRARTRFAALSSAPVSEIDSCSGSYEDRADLQASFPDRNETVELTFFLNGERQGSVSEPLWQNVAASERRLYPAVSLYKKGSKAVIRCCKEDWQTKRSVLVGPGEQVYSVCSE